MSDVAELGKLGAYLGNGGEGLDLDEPRPWLYLGAAQGETAAALAERVGGPPVLAVEKSPVASLGLVETARSSENLVPYVGDAGRPGDYAPLVPELGHVYQDLAQKEQVEIFLDNVRRFRPERGFLAVKARSIAVDRPPEEVFEEAGQALAREGELVDVVRLDPHHRDHAMIVADFRGADRG